MNVTKYTQTGQPAKSKATYGDNDVDDDKHNLRDRSQDSQAPHLASSTAAADVCLHTIALNRNQEPHTRQNPYKRSALALGGGGGHMTSIV